MTQLLHWARVNAQRWPPLYAALRAMKRRFSGMRRPSGSSAHVPPLPEDAFRARVTTVGPLPRFSVGTPATVAVEVKNTSQRMWPGHGQVAISYHWRRTDGSLWAFDGGRTALPVPVEAGGHVRLECPVKPPNTPATYVLEMDLVHGRDAWFGQHGSETVRQEIVVGGMQPEAFPEIDYERIYNAADLGKDYWTVAGPASAEEFQQLGKAKLEMLRGLGLTPRSRVLDVGCGTGNLAEALMDFLGSDGLYHGTDLSEVAVKFCREKYVRPNFLFAKSEMTSVPIEGVRFDIVVFFSVFTHTYPEETRQLLGEAKRLLDDGGLIVADVFESDFDGDCLGTRAMIVLNRKCLVGLAEAMGLEARTISEFAWDPTGPRRIDRVLRRFARLSHGLNV